MSSEGTWYEHQTPFVKRSEGLLHYTLLSSADNQLLYTRHIRIPILRLTWTMCFPSVFGTCQVQLQSQARHRHCRNIVDQAQQGSGLTKEYILTRWRSQNDKRWLFRARTWVPVCHLGLHDLCLSSLRLLLFSELQHLKFATPLWCAALINSASKWSRK